MTSALLPLNDPRWNQYCGGYNRAVVDVVPFELARRFNLIPIDIKDQTLIFPC